LYSCTINLPSPKRKNNPAMALELSSILLNAQSQGFSS